MLKRVTLSLLFALCTIVSFNTAHAAFPTEKKSEAAATTSVAKAGDKAFSQSLSNKEVKRESKALLKKSVNSSGGKSRIVAALLAFFLGGLGIHSFYMGQTQKGLVQLGLTVLGFVLLIAGVAGYIASEGTSYPTLAIVGELIIFGVGIWALVDFVRILTGSLAPEEGFDD